MKQQHTSTKLGKEHLDWMEMCRKKMSQGQGCSAVPQTSPAEGALRLHGGLSGQEGSQVWLAPFGQVLPTWLSPSVGLGAVLG